MEAPDAFRQTAAVLFLPPDGHQSGAGPGAGGSGLLPWRMVAMLCCPYCHGDLDARGTANDAGIADGTLSCQSRACQASFVIRGGIPDLMPAGSNAWRRWESHLSQGQRRRSLRIADAARLAGKTQAAHRGLQQAFVRFTAITHGVILDVGCGPGQLRGLFDSAHVDYYGIDPKPRPEARAFPFARALAEFIPFKDGVFTDVVVGSALHHVHDPAAFFTEVSRVLEPNGKLHMAEAESHLAGPVWLATHRAGGEDRHGRTDQQSGPHPTADDRQHSLVGRMPPWFTLIDEGRFSLNWYSPEQRFVTLARRQHAPLSG